LVLGIVSGLIAVALFAGGVVASHMRLRAEMDAKFHVYDMTTQKQHEELMLRLSGIEDHIMWTENSVETLATEIPRAIELHEYKMHQKEFLKLGSPTKFEIKLPRKPKVGFATANHASMSP
jgi:hypothetical protein